tara:strand:+ start:248 stop:409 length:162 start_codon:yes stop_codon:yes gene_type:complete
MLWRIIQLRLGHRNEKTKTVEYQKKSWADGKEQLANTWLQIKSLIGKKNVTQD